MSRGALLGAGLMLLAACTGAPEDKAVSYEDELARARAQAAPGAAAPRPPRPARDLAAAPVVPVGGPLEIDAAGGPLQLEALGHVIQVDLGPILEGCSFQQDGETLLVAGAEQDSAARGRGVIQVGGSQRLLVGVRPGGPGYINAGPVLADDGFTVEVRRGGGEGLSGEMERTSWPAELVVQRGTAGEHTYGPGTWTCGV